MSASILVVDDEKDVLTVMAKGLQIAGFKVDAKNDPLQALSEFKAGIYDMALLDVRMPNLSGFDLYEKLSQVDKKIKVCFLSAFDVNYFETFKGRFANVPSRCFIRKPVSIKTMVEIVKTELGFAISSQ
jgi:DNA-binding response OmpR family regulator